MPASRLGLLLLCGLLHHVERLTQNPADHLVWHDRVLDANHLDTAALPREDLLGRLLDLLQREELVALDGLEQVASVPGADKHALRVDALADGAPPLEVLAVPLRQVGLGRGEGLGPVRLAAELAHEILEAEVVALRGVVRRLAVIGAVHNGVEIERRAVGLRGVEEGAGVGFPRGVDG